MKRLSWVFTLGLWLASALAAGIAQAQTFTNLATFSNTDGRDPQGNVTVSADGSTLYGMTTSGGADNDGTIFSLPASGGTPTVLTSFNGTDGANPYGSLTLAGSTLYGMTYGGGANGDGAIFSVPVTGGTPTVLASFNGTDGKLPQGSLTLSANGSTLYGMTPYGGAHNEGTIFSIPVTGGTPTTLLSFNSGVNGAYPEGGLTLSANGSTLYGMTSQGGPVVGNSSDGPVIFSISVTGGSFTNLYTFGTGLTQAFIPQGDLTLSGSTLYGMAQGGGTYGLGEVFSLPVTGGTPMTVASFSASGGFSPVGDVTLVGSTLYGMTPTANSGNGAIFSVPASGGNPDFLATFGPFGPVGNDPKGSLTLSGSTLYGMTSLGDGTGTVFSLALVPEPSSLVLLGLGALGFAVMAARRRMRRRLA